MVKRMGAATIATSSSFNALNQNGLTAFYSHAQISPFKSIEFEIFAKNLSFLMFKSYKSTIMQI